MLNKTAWYSLRIPRKSKKHAMTEKKTQKYQTSGSSQVKNCQNFLTLVEKIP